MNSTDVRATTGILADLIWKKDRQALSEFLNTLPPQDLPIAVSRLDTSDRSELLEMLDADDAADLLLALRELSPHDMLARISPEAAAAILHELPSDIETDIVGALKPRAAKRILEMLPKGEMDEVRNLASYDPDVAGGLMVTEILHYPTTATIRQVVDDLRTNAAVYADYNIQYIYVTDVAETLVGVLRIRDLLLTESETVLGDLIIEQPVTTDHLTGLDELSDVFDSHRFLGLPVVADGRLLGVVRRAAVEEAIAQKTARQFRLVQGIICGFFFALGLASLALSSGYL
jgi:magnesium transporter